MNEHYGYCIMKNILSVSIRKGIAQIYQMRITSHEDSVLPINAWVDESLLLSWAAMHFNAFCKPNSTWRHYDPPAWPLCIFR